MSTGTATSYKPKYASISDELERQLAQHPPHKKLPSIRRLMKQFDASQATIDRGLRNLMERGVVQRIPGRGYFTAASTVKDDERLKVDFCFFFKKRTLNNPLYSEISRWMLTEMYHRGCHLNILAYEEMGCLKEFRRRLDESRPDAFVMLGCSKMTFEHVLREMDVPAIHVCPNVWDANSLCYLIDNHGAMELSIDHLTDLGHERIVLLHGQGYDGVHMVDQEERIDAYYDIMAKKNLATSGESVLYGGFSAEEGYEAGRKVLSASPRKRPTAILCNDYNAAGVYSAIHDAGMKIPGNVSVIGFDNIREIDCLPVKLTTIDICLESMLGALSEDIYDLAMGKEFGPDKIRTKVALIKRESTGMVVDGA
ncbi:MAG: GntR family transcriptional regulator [Candidatus Pacebacteria bacterium]|nr:GntR family transcriptional regulator [Candidatus Paceibacterota bacterium]